MISNNFQFLFLFDLNVFNILVTDTSNIMSQSTYTKYINSFITLEALSKFMSTQQAHKIHQKSLEILKTKNKNKFKGEVNI